MESIRNIIAEQNRAVLFSHYEPAAVATGSITTSLSSSYLFKKLIKVDS